MCPEAFKSGLTEYHGFSQDGLYPISSSPVHGESILDPNATSVRLKLIPNLEWFSAQVPEVNPLFPDRRAIKLGVRRVDIERTNDRSKVVNYRIAMTPQANDIPIQFLDHFVRECKRANLVEDWVGIDNFIPTYSVTNDALSISYDDGDLISFDREGFDINLDLLRLDEKYQKEGKRAFYTREFFPYGFECEVFNALTVDKDNPDIRRKFSVKAGYSFPHEDFLSLNSEVLALLEGSGNIDDIFDIMTPFLRVDLEREQEI